MTDGEPLPGAAQRLASTPETKTATDRKTTADEASAARTAETGTSGEPAAGRGSGSGSDPEPGSSPDSVAARLDHLFRQEAGRLVALLTRGFGAARMDLAEEMVQEAMVRALRRWPYHGMPEDPAGWLYRVARNLALDHVRRDATFREKEPAIRDRLPTVSPAPETGLAGDITDDQLRLVFLCCHPALPRDSRVALTLKTVGGFSAAEIARGFLAREATVAQRLVRAQRRIRELGLRFELPGEKELPERLEAVFDAIYLMFNEGYAGHGGDRWIRRDLCAEALRLVVSLTRLQLPGFDVRLRARAHALASLLFFQASRLEARQDSAGGLVLLADQDRSLWDRRALRLGFAHLEKSGVGDRISPYHLQAHIASYHASAADDSGTEWSAILELYDQLARLEPTPVVLLNRAVAVAEVHGVEAALEAVAVLEQEVSLERYHLLHAVRADLLRRRGERAAAAEAYRRALELAGSTPERLFLGQRLAELEALDGGP